MHVRLPVTALLSILSLAAMTAQTRKEQPTAACPAQPSTLRAMRDCYRPLLVFAPSLDNPQLKAQFSQLQGHTPDLKSREILYVPIVPEGHNQPIPASHIPTARLSEDELAAAHQHFQVENGSFLVVLLGKDGGIKLKSRTPVSVDQLKRLIDSMPMRQGEMKQQGEP